MLALTNNHSLLFTDKLFQQKFLWERSDERISFIRRKLDCYTLQNNYDFLCGLEHSVTWVKFMKLLKRVYEYIIIINLSFQGGDVAANRAFKLGNGAFKCFEPDTFSYTYIYMYI